MFRDMLQQNIRTMGDFLSVKQDVHADLKISSGILSILCSYKLIRVNLIFLSIWYLWRDWITLLPLNNSDAYLLIYFQIDQVLQLPCLHPYYGVLVLKGVWELGYNISSIICLGFKLVRFNKCV